MKQIFLQFSNRISADQNLHTKVLLISWILAAGMFLLGWYAFQLYAGAQGIRPMMLDVARGLRGSGVLLLINGMAGSWVLRYINRKLAETQ